jgi:hypothetical protein
VFQLTIPVIVADNIVEPWERFLDYRSFTAKLLTPEVVLEKDAETVLAGDCFFLGWGGIPGHRVRANA